MERGHGVTVEVALGADVSSGGSGAVGPHLGALDSDRRCCAKQGRDQDCRVDERRLALLECGKGEGEGEREG